MGASEAYLDFRGFQAGSRNAGRSDGSLRRCMHACLYFPISIEWFLIFITDRHIYQSLAPPVCTPDLLYMVWTHSHRSPCCDHKSLGYREGGVRCKIYVPFHLLVSGLSHGMLRPRQCPLFIQSLACSCNDESGSTPMTFVWPKARIIIRMKQDTWDPGGCGWKNSRCEIISYKMTSLES